MADPNVLQALLQQHLLSLAPQLGGVGLTANALPTADGDTRGGLAHEQDTGAQPLMTSFASLPVPFPRPYRSR